MGGGGRLGPRIVYGKIDHPWAIDAHGKSPPTKYLIEGATITQVVETKNAAFPVVADPKITLGSGVYLNMYGIEINAVGAVGAALLGISGMTVCGASSKLPIKNIGKQTVDIVCNIGGASLAAAMVKASVNNRSFAPLQCYQLRYPLTGRGFVGVGSENCRK